MAAPSIHPTAVVHPGAKLGNGVSVAPYALIEDNVHLGDGCEVGPHALVAWGTRMGKRCKVFHAATVGTIPQDLKFVGEETLCRIGDDTTIREYVSINRGTKANGETVIGSHCALLAYCHVGHDCVIGDHLVVSNSLAMAGHVIVGSHVTMGGMCSFHQFCRVGDHAFVGANSFVIQDVPPFALVAAQPTRIVGINKVGLERRGFDPDRRAAISRAFRILFRQNLLRDEAFAKLKAEFPGNPDIEALSTFVSASKRGVVQMGSGAEE
jgi:UDP-N-acetylglucosamine acyltransferase